MRSFLLSLLLVLLFTLPSFGWVRDGAPPCSDGTVTFSIKLGKGYDDTNLAAYEALWGWNPYMKRVQLAGILGEGLGTKDNGINEVFFDNELYGKALDKSILALTYTHYDDKTRYESDIVVNNALPWGHYFTEWKDSPGDLERVLAHEFGHVLGLDHPDEHKQSVLALMNSHVSELTLPQMDDAAGVAGLYGATPDLIAHFNFVTPGAMTLYASEEIRLSASYASALPCTFVWTRDGIDLPDTNSSTLVIPNAKVADSGTYRIRITNEGGSLTGGNSLVTVKENFPPELGQLPDLTVDVGQAVLFTVAATSRTAMQYQWKKDGAPLQGATQASLSIAKVSLTDAGLYTLTATNGVGSSTSNAARLTVNPARPPVITEQPGDIVIWECPVSYEMSVRCTGSEPFSYAWYRNGVLLPEYTSPDLWVGNITRSVAGTYTVVISNAAGSVTSNPALLDVIPQPIPTTVLRPSLHGQLGEPLLLTGYQGDAPGSNSFQWYKDGQAIAGATNASYSMPALTAKDEGDYLLTITCPRGTSVSNLCHVSVGDYGSKPPGAWVGTARLGDVAYFAFANPARIDTYNLRTGAWGPSVALPSAATAFCAGNGKLFVACDSSLYRVYPDSLIRTLVVTTPGLRYKGLAWLRNQVFAYQVDLDNKAQLVGYDEFTATPNPYLISLNAAATSPALFSAPKSGDLLTVSFGGPPCYLTKSNLSPGLESGSQNGTYYDAGDQGKNARLCLSSDEALIYCNSGVVFNREDLRYGGNVGAFTDLANDDQGNPVTLYHNKLQCFDTGLRQTGSLTLDQPGQALYVLNGKAFVFSYPESGTPGLVQTVSLASANTGSALPGINPEALLFTPDSIDLDADGTVLLTCRLLQQVFRWNPETRKYAPQHFPLHATPDRVAVSRSLNRMYLSYADGKVCQLDLSKPQVPESFFYQTHGPALGLVTADQNLLLHDYAGGGHYNVLLDANGRRRDAVAAPTADYYAWSPKKGRLYGTGVYWQGWQELTSNGLLALPTNRQSVQHRAALWPSPEGTSLLTPEGLFLDSETLQPGTQLASRTLLDCTWNGGRLFTVRNTLDGALVERWGGPGYGRDASLLVSGQPLRLLTLPSGRLLMAFLREARLYFALLDEGLSILSVDGSGAKATVSNLSTRAEAGVNDNTLTPSFVIEGTQPKRILIRAVGPTLKNFGLANPIPDPLITVYNDKQTAIAGNDNWGSSANLADLTGTSDRLGAFALNAGSKDAALLLTLQPGAYTAQVSDAKGSVGTAMAEIYDTDEGNGTSRLSNMALRGKVGAGDSTMIVGFVISGNAPRTLLIRGIGPALARFGVTGTVADPVLKLFMQGSDTPLFTNDNWGNASAIVSAAAAVGAFALDPASKDACLLVSLNPGAYTAHLVSTDDSAGVGLLELYLMPE